MNSFLSFDQELTKEHSFKLLVTLCGTLLQKSDDLWILVLIYAERHHLCLFAVVSLTSLCGQRQGHHLVCR